MSSVQFKEQVTSTQVTGKVAEKGKEDLVHEIGNALTKATGPGGYLAVSYIDGSHTSLGMLTKGAIARCRLISSNFNPTLCAPRC